MPNFYYFNVRSSDSQNKKQLWVEWNSLSNSQAIIFHFVDIPF